MESLRHTESTDAFEASAEDAENRKKMMTKDRKSPLDNESGMKPAAIVSLDVLLPRLKDSRIDEMDLLITFKEITTIQSPYVGTLSLLAVL